MEKKKTKTSAKKAEKPSPAKTIVKKPTQEDFEKAVLELAKKGLTSEKIGEQLRSQGIHPKEYQKKISQILGDKYVNPDLKNIETKLGKIQKHFDKNKGDKKAMREKERVAAQLRRARKFFREA